MDEFTKIVNEDISKRLGELMVANITLQKQVELLVKKIKDAESKNDLRVDEDEVEDLT